MIETNTLAYCTTVMKKKNFNIDTRTMTLMTWDPRSYKTFYIPIKNNNSRLVSHFGGKRGVYPSVAPFRCLTNFNILYYNPEPLIMLATQGQYSLGVGSKSVIGRC